MYTHIIYIIYRDIIYIFLKIGKLKESKVIRTGILEVQSAIHCETKPPRIGILDKRSRKGFR